MGREVKEAVVVVDSVSRHFGQVVAVDQISFSVQRGEVCALLGGNGAGKTTTLSMLLGLLLPTAGSVRVLGADMRNHRYRVLPRINFSSPYVDLPMRLTVEENLVVYGHLYGVRRVKQRVARLAQELDLNGFIRRPYGTLSAGQKTRVALAKALLNEPELLLLDEPTASLDPDTADRIRGFLVEYQQRSDATILMATHNMLEVERICSQVIMLREGRIVDSGTPQGLLDRYGHQTMEEVFLDVARSGSSVMAAREAE